MSNFMKNISKGMVNVIHKDKKRSKFAYYYNLIGISIFPMWIVLTAWILLELLIEGKVTDSLVDNIVAMLTCIASFVVLLTGMFIGRELELRKQKEERIAMVEEISKKI